MMFKFELNQTIYYIRNNRLHSAPVLARMRVENLREDWAHTQEQKSLFTPFGVACECYATCHGIVTEKEAADSKEEIVKKLVDA
jgi:hypothetical protein